MNYLNNQFKTFINDTTRGSYGSYGSSLENWYITVERAEGIKDKDRWSKSDPYVIIEFGGKRVRTRTIKNDRTPYWNETFNFKLSSSNNKDINLKLYDEDFGPDDIIGTAIVSQADLPDISGQDKYIQVAVRRKEQITGIVHLRVKKVVDAPISSSSSTSYPQRRDVYSSSSSSSTASPNNYPFNAYQQNQQQQQIPSSYQYPQSQQQIPSSYYPQQQQQPYYSQQIPQSQPQAPPFNPQYMQSQQPYPPQSYIAPPQQQQQPPMMMNPSSQPYPPYSSYPSYPYQPQPQQQQQTPYYGNQIPPRY